MSTDIKLALSQLLQSALASVAPDHTVATFQLDRPKDPTHGDFASNLALQLAKPLRRNPRELANLLVAELPKSDLVSKVDIAGAGFINFHLAKGTKTAIIRKILNQGGQFGRIDQGEGLKVQVEFVSANPTGPLHVGHGRGAAYGASLSDVLDFAGYDVTREYYINDAGRQMDILATSTWLRYLALNNVVVPFPPNGYQGDYVVDMAKEIFAGHAGRFVRGGAEDVLLNAPDVVTDKEAHLDALIWNAKRLLGEDYAWIHSFVLDEQLGDCREDLAEFGVRFDKWFSEKSLFDTGLVAKYVAELDKRGHLYEQNGAKWFRSTAFGDEKDRVVQRDNGIFTYFASDIAYHANKLERGFERIIDIWGADHHGYIPRVKGALLALGLPADKLDVTLVQFAVLYRGGEKASMSTRSGDFVTLRELRREVGNDACRFFYVLRKSDQHLDFDLDLAKSQSNENPVYYIQYAHARVCSVLSQWDGDLAELANADFSVLESEREAQLCNRLAQFPEVIGSAAQDYAPHQIAFYLKDLSSDFHTWYNAERMLVEDEVLKCARLALAASIKQVLVTGLRLLGVSAPDKM